MSGSSAATRPRKRGTPDPDIVSASLVVLYLERRITKSSLKILTWRCLATLRLGVNYTWNVLDSRKDAKAQRNAERSSVATAHAPRLAEFERELAEQFFRLCESDCQRHLFVVD